MYGELVMGHHLAAHPAVCFKDIFKRDMKHRGTDPGSWEHGSWHHAVHEVVKGEEENKTSETNL